MEIAWDQIIFDNTLLGQVPEEGVSRLVTQQISERRDHYVRYGLAFMLEHGFMKTERGRLCYRMNLEQIRNAILETAYLGVMDAYLRCKRPSFMGGIRAGMQRLTGRSLARALSQVRTVQRNLPIWPRDAFSALSGVRSVYVRCPAHRCVALDRPEGLARLRKKMVRMTRRSLKCGCPDGPKTENSRFVGLFRRWLKASCFMAGH